MAWPLTPLTTYLPGQLPAIKAADLNAFQNAINRGFAGTYSTAGLVLDGVGGNTVAPAPGSLTASGDGKFAGALSVAGSARVVGSISAGGGLSAGGSIVTGGFVELGASAGGTKAPTPQVARGILYADSCVVAFGQTDNQGNLNAGFGVQSIANGGSPGFFDVTLQLTVPNRLIPVANTSAGVPALVLSTMVNTHTVRFQTYAFQNGAWAFLTLPLSFVVFGV